MFIFGKNTQLLQSQKYNIFQFYYFIFFDIPFINARAIKIYFEDSFIYTTTTNGRILNKETTKKILFLSLLRRVEYYPFYTSWFDNKKKEEKRLTKQIIGKLNNVRVYRGTCVVKSGISQLIYTSLTLLILMWRNIAVAYSIRRDENRAKVDSLYRRRRGNFQPHPVARVTLLYINISLADFFNIKSTWWQTKGAFQL